MVSPSVCVPLFVTSVSDLHPRGAFSGDSGDGESYVRIDRRQDPPKYLPD